jgi:amino acid adenylation domain-containing protein
LISRLVQDAPPSGPCCLSFEQQRLWFLEQLGPGNTAYNLAFAVRLRGHIDTAALGAALSAVVARHETLRTSFVVRDEEPLQVVAEPATVANLPLVDLQQLPNAERDAELDEVLRADAQRPFDLSRDLMLRPLLVRLAPDDHVLLITLHQIVSDGLSLKILARELSELYNAHLEGRSATLSPLPIQYRDYAVWQRAAMTGDMFRSQLAYWTQRLTGMPPTLELATDRSRPPVLNYQGAQETVVLSSELANALKALSRREQATLFMTLLAAFQALLQRYTGTDDVVIGTAIAGRQRPETEALIGFFVNVLALRTDLAGDPTFREMLARVRDVVLGAFDHQDLPFEKVVEALRPERSLSWLPLVQVMFLFQDPDPAVLALAGVTATPLDVDARTAQFDLALSVTETPHGLVVKLTYRTQLYEPATIRRMLGHYHTLLRSIVADPDQRLSRLPLLTPPEHHQLLVEWNATHAPVPGQCVHELFEAQVRRTPDATAVTLDGQSLTYRELNQRANQLARSLQRRGVGPDVLVGLCLDRSLDMIVALFGILKAGGAYVPLNPADPRLGFMLRDAQVSVLVTHRPILQRLPLTGVPAVCLDDEWHAIAHEADHDVASPVELHNLAYVIYTSGSTGTPKGVMIPHGAVSNLMAWLLAALPSDGTEIHLQRSPVTFDASVHEIFHPLLAGAKLVLLPPRVHRDPRALIDIIRTEHISRLMLVPSLMQAMVEEPGLKTCSSLRCVMCGGEVLSWNLVRRFREYLDCEVVNLYGPTETTVWGTSYTIPSSAPAKYGETVPVGRPLSNTQLYILDPCMQPVPIGVPGELHIGGLGLARGYLGRREMTAERFVPNPFSSTPGDRVYKTGDRVRYLPDGTIEYLGRLDYQVKIRGFRIELGEIEATLRDHPAVGDTVVVAREETSGDKRLVAYVVPRPNTLAAQDVLRRFVQARLPQYMVPSAFVALPELPLTSSGKVDRRRLPTPDFASATGECVPPSDPIERQLVRIWEALLGVRPIGVTNNFFELGGHSLLAARLVAHIEKTLGKELPLSAIFQAPTVERLARLLRHDADHVPQTLIVPPEPGDSKIPLFFISCSKEFVRRLRPMLSSDQPCYALAPHGFDGRRAPSTVEQMAAKYLKEIQSLQPEGPYYLVGYSFGGMAAFEVAQQLRRQGQGIGLLVLLDPLPRPIVEQSPLPVRNSAAALPAKLKTVLDYVRRCCRWRPIKPGQMIAVARRLAKTTRQSYRSVRREFTNIVCACYLGTGRRVPPSLRKFYFIEASHRAARTYTPQMYPGHALLIVIERHAFDLQRAWGALVAGGIETHVVPTDHSGIMRDEPLTQVLAGWLIAHLHAAQPATGETIDTEVASGRSTAG